MLEYLSLVNPLFNYHLGANVSYFITISQAYSVHVLQPISSFNTTIVAALQHPNHHNC